MKRMIFGEKMPDKNDPKYQERYHDEVDAGKRFAKTCKLDKLGVKIQSFAQKHSKWFLALVFGFLIGSYSINIGRMVCQYMHESNQTKPLLKQTNQVNKEYRHHDKDTRKDKL